MPGLLLSLRFHPHDFDRGTSRFSAFQQAPGATLSLRMGIDRGHLAEHSMLTVEVREESTRQFILVVLDWLTDSGYLCIYCESYGVELSNASDEETLRRILAQFQGSSRGRRSQARHTVSLN
jgi:hypothetical protein